MNRIIHFEIQAADPENAAKFYQEIFGWSIKEWEVPGMSATIVNENRYWVVTTGESPEPGINGGIVFRRGPKPEDNQGVNAFVCTIGVSSITEYIDKIIAAGGTMALPKMAIPSIGWLAYCKDLDENIFGMMQDDPSAGVSDAN